MPVRQAASLHTRGEATAVKRALFAMCSTKSTFETRFVAAVDRAQCVRFAHSQLFRMRRFFAAFFRALCTVTFAKTQMAVTPFFAALLVARLAAFPFRWAYARNRPLDAKHPSRANSKVRVRTRKFACQLETSRPKSIIRTRTRGPRECFAPF